MLPQNLVVCNLFLLCAVSTHSSLGLKITIQPHYCYIRYLYTGFSPPLYYLAGTSCHCIKERIPFFGYSLFCAASLVSVQNLIISV